MSLRPLEDRVVVRPNEPESTSPGGLIIPDNAQEKSQRGEVIAVGPGRWSDMIGITAPMPVEVGDTVVYSRHGGVELTIDGEEVLVLASRDIIGVIQERPALTDGPLLDDDTEPF